MVTWHERKQGGCSCANNRNDKLVINQELDYEYTKQAKHCFNVSGLCVFFIKN